MKLTDQTMFWLQHGHFGDSRLRATQFSRHLVWIRWPHLKILEIVCAFVKSSIQMMHEFSPNSANST